MTWGSSPEILPTTKLLIKKEQLKKMHYGYCFLGARPLGVPPLSNYILALKCDEFVKARYYSGVLAMSLSTYSLSSSVIEKNRQCL